MFLVYVVFRFFSSTFVLARRRFAIDLTIFETIDFLVSMCRVFLIGFGAVTLLAKDLISMNELHRSLREAIEMRGAMKSSKSNILDEVVKCGVKEKYQDLKIRRSMDPKSIIGPARSSSRSSIDLVTIKSIVIFIRQ